METLKHSFNNIFGNEKIINNMRLAIVNRKVSHAYIIDGPEGMGKKSIAFAFAKALQCSNSVANGGNACLKCTSCKTFDSLNNPDVIYVVPEKTKALGVLDIRLQVVKNMETKPYLYKYKIFIIDNASEMTVAAQNALLKTLEEPAQFGLFILLSKNARSFLSTVLSRTVTFHLKPLKTELVQEYLLKKESIVSEKARFSAVYSSGNIGRAIRIATDDNFLEMREKVINMLVGINNSDLVESLLLVKQWEFFKENIAECLDIAILWFRDLAILLIDGENIIQNDIIGKLENEAKKININKALSCIEAVLKAKRQLLQNANFQLVIEVMLLDFIAN